MRKQLPVHAIDTGVLIEAALGKPSETRHLCERYLLRSGQTYRPALTAPLAHELVALAREKDSKGREQLLDIVIGLVHNPDSVVLHPRWATFERILALRELDPRLDPLDAFHLASAIEAGASVFVTLDPMLLKSEVLKNGSVLVRDPRTLLEHPLR